MSKVDEKVSEHFICGAIEKVVFDKNLKIYLSVPDSYDGDDYKYKIRFMGKHPIYGTYSSLMILEKSIFEEEDSKYKEMYKKITIENLEKQYEKLVKEKEND